MASKSPISPLKTSDVTFTNIVAEAVSPYTSDACTVILQDIASEGAVPLMSNVDLSKTNHNGISAVTETSIEAGASWPSRLRLLERPWNVTSAPGVASSIISSLLNASRWIPTSISKGTDAPAKPSTSDSVICIPNVCGGCIKEV